MKMKCLVVDDEPLARAGIENYIKQTPFLELCGSAADGIEALELCAGQETDLLFLDVNMPRLSGLELITSLVQKPLIIMVTAYSEFAVQGFELDVVDYLVKPIAYPRFLKAVNKAQELKNLTAHQGSSRKYIVIKTEGRLQKIFADEILYIEGRLNYVAIYTANKKFITYSSLKNMEAELPPKEFVKIHKSYIVSVSKVTGIEGNQVCINHIKLPISKTLKEAVLAAVL